MGSAALAAAVGLPGRARRPEFPARDNEVLNKIIVSISHRTLAWTAESLAYVQAIIGFILHAYSLHRGAGIAQLLERRNRD